MKRKNIIYQSFLMFFLIFVFSIITGCINHYEDEKYNQPIKNSLNIGINDPIFGFFPWIESYDVYTMMINMNIFNNLVDFDHILRLKPKLAISWNNPDNLTWRFNLRENVKFHNGYNFTSEDVKFTIDLIKSNQTHVLKDLLTSVKEVRIIGKYIVDIITHKPCPTLLNKLVDIPIASKKYIEENIDTWPIGTGPYKLVEYEPENYVKLEKNDEYWEDLEVKNVTFRIIENDDEMKNASLSGEIDIASYLQPKYYNDIMNCPSVRLGSCSHPMVIFLSFDFRENNSLAFKSEKNPFSDVRVRKAIYHTINISEIIDNVLNGSNFAKPASQFVSPMIFGYNPTIERLPYDPELAKSLMKDAGYEEGFELILDCPDVEDQVQICKLLQIQLSEIIEVKLNLLSIEDFYSKLTSRNSSFYIVGWHAATGDGGEIFDYMIRTVDEEAGIGTYNMGYYSNKEVDMVGENISHILNPEERLDLMQEGFKIAMDDVAWIPLYIPTIIYCISNDILWEPNPNMMIAVEETSFKK